jgi:hypothetical protein
MDHFLASQVFMEMEKEIAEHRFPLCSGFYQTEQGFEATVAREGAEDVTYLTPGSVSAVLGLLLSPTEAAVAYGTIWARIYH